MKDKCYSNLLKAGLSLTFKSERAWNTPLHLQIEPTNNCNLNCKFCSRKKSVKSSSQMSPENFQNIFDQINPLRVTWAGRGEPLLAESLIKMIGYAKQKGARTIVTTNFTLGKQLAGDLVATGLENLRISIDAANPEIYKSMRGKDFHGRILDGINRINKLKLQKNVDVPKLSFEIVLTRENLAEGEEIIKLAKEYKVNNVNFRPLGLVGIEDRKDDLVPGLDSERFLERLRKWREYAEVAQVKTNLNEFIKQFPFFWARYKGKAQKSAGCIYLWLQGYINVTGELTPCCALNMDEGISLGNVFRDGFMETWNGKAYKNFRKITRDGEFLFQSCRQCVPKRLLRTIKRTRFFK